MLIPQYLNSKYEKYSCTIVSVEDLTQNEPSFVSTNKTPFEPHSLRATEEIEEKSMFESDGRERQAQLKEGGRGCIGGSEMKRS